MEDSAKVNKVIRHPDELPTGWHNATLAEVAEITMGQSPSSQHYNSDGKGLPFFQGKAEFGQLYPEAVKWCTQPNKVAQKDNVLISVRAPVGPTNLAPSKCCIGRGLAAIQPRDGTPSKYIMYYLRSIESDVDALGTGTTFKAISGGILRSIPIPVAPPEQQKQIVAELEKQFSRLDEAVTNLKRVKASLKRYKAAVLKAAVEGRLTQEWRKQHPDVEPASKLLERILTERRAKQEGMGKYEEPPETDETELPPLPDGWTWTSVASLTFTGPQNGLYLPRSLYGTGTPILRIDDFQDGWSRTSDELQKVRASQADVKTYSLEVGDFVINRVNSPSHLGKALVVLHKNLPALFESNMMRLKLSSHVQTQFIALYLQSVDGRKGLTKNAKWAVNQASINQRDVGVTKLPLPPFEEQLCIVSEVERRLSVIEELDAAVKANLTRADRFKQSILRFLGGF